MLFLRSLCALLLLASLLVPARADEPQLEPLPDFDQPKASRWLNSDPLNVEDLRGKVILLEFWTFGCINCVRSIPFVQRVEELFGEQGLVVIGVHTPEFDHERNVKNVRQFLDDQGIAHPTLIDNGYRYWRKLNNRYWPAFYLVDKQGKIRNVTIGEMHADTPRATEFEGWIEQLLAE